MTFTMSRTQGFPGYTVIRLNFADLQEKNSH